MAWAVSLTSSCGLARYQPAVSQGGEDAEHSKSLRVSGQPEPCEQERFAASEERPAEAAQGRRGIPQKLSDLFGRCNGVSKGEAGKNRPIRKNRNPGLSLREPKPAGAGWRGWDAKVRSTGTKASY